MPTRKETLVNGEVYHVFSRSIAGFRIFNDDSEFDRMATLLRLYRFQDFDYKLSQFLDLEIATKSAIIRQLEAENIVLIDIIAFCLMPTHIHLILKQKIDQGITGYIGRVLNGYSRYFNEKHRRNGPLWSSRFKNVLVSSDEQLLHLTRYIHLNPTSMGLVNRPEEWLYSSYRQYSKQDDSDTNLCEFHGLLDINPEQYARFVNDRKSYQKELSLIKNITIDGYTG